MRAGKVLPLSSFYSSPGYSDEKIHLFLALDLRQTGTTPDAGEFLRVKKYRAAEIMEMISRGDIEDGKTILGVSLVVNLYNEFI